ncbi:hypothetical protein ACFUC1_17890 [Pedococcus sp. NPDC057267]|uniref:hypothetical protein n=1 Tax=Pedococcus sp. NPDC057267 TaxID=3346077 RepID=UPI00363F83F3
MEPADDSALEGFLLRVQALGQGPAPTPNERLAAVLGVPAPARVHRIAPRTVAGATALAVATLVGTGWAAAAADRLPAPAQRAVSRLTAGWLPGIPQPQDPRTGGGTTPPAVLPTPTTTAPVPTSGDGQQQPERQTVAPARPSGTRSEDTEGPDGGDRSGSGSQDRSGEGEDSSSPSPSGTRTAPDAGPEDDSASGDGSTVGTTPTSTSGSGDVAPDGQGTGSDDEHDVSGTSSGGAGSDG